MSTPYAGDPTNFPTTIPVPSDDDDRDANSVSTALEGLADRTATLAKLRLVCIVVGKSDDAASGHAATTTYTPTGSFVDVVKLVDLTGLAEGDIVEINAVFWVHTSANGGVYLRLGHSTTFLAVDCDIPEQTTDEWTGGVRVQMHAYFVVDASHTGSKPVYLQARGEPLTLQIRKPQVVVAKVYRGS